MEGQQRSCYSGPPGTQGVGASRIIDGVRQLQGFAIRSFPVGSKFFYGLAASTGAAAARKEIRNVKITFPSPRCL